MRMNISPRLAASILAFAAFTAHAEVKNFEFTATVRGGNTPVALAGDKITGSFSYDTSELPIYTDGDPAGDGFVRSRFEISRPLVAKVNGHAIQCGAFSVVVTSNFGGNREDMLNVGCSDIVLDGTKTRGGSFSILLATGPGIRDVITDTTSLPSVIDVSRFDHTEDSGVLTENSVTGVAGFSFFVNEIKTVQAAATAKRQ